MKALILGWCFRLFCIATTVASTAHAQSIVPGGLNLVCPLMEYERQRTLEDSRVELQLVENEYRARQRVFEMVAKLWAARSIEQELYLDYRRLRDRTKARVARLTTQVSQDRTAAEQYALVCAQPRAQSTEHIEEKIGELQAEYRRLDCELLARDSEIAGIDYEFDKAMLEATHKLTAGSVKSRYELVIDEYDLSQSKARFESYRKRTTICKRRVAG